MFCDLEARDLVTSYARNLASKVGSDGKPTAGLRMNIPPRLMSLFKLLEAHGRRLKQRYGTELKRHVHFDDDDLYLPKCTPAWRGELDEDQRGIRSFDFQGDRDVDGVAREAWDPACGQRHQSNAGPE